MIRTRRGRVAFVIPGAMLRMILICTNPQAVTVCKFELSSTSLGPTLQPAVRTKFEWSILRGTECHATTPGPHWKSRGGVLTLAHQANDIGMAWAELAGQCKGGLVVVVTTETLPTP